MIEALKTPSSQQNFIQSLNKVIDTVSQYTIGEYTKFTKTQINSIQEKGPLNSFQTTTLSG